MNFYTRLDIFRMPGEKDRPFAKRCGIDHTRLSVWRNAKDPKPELETVDRIITQLGISEQQGYWLAFGKAAPAWLQQETQNYQE